MQDDRHATANGRDERVGGAQIDADREAMLVRRRGLPWLRNLK
jgi:hypothetical protein